MKGKNTMNYHKIIAKLSALEDELFDNGLLNSNTERHLIGLIKYIKNIYRKELKK